MVQNLRLLMAKVMSFNNLEDEGLVVKINSRELTVEQRWPTAPCAKPASLAMDRENRRLFVGCRSKVMAVMNADTGQVNYNSSHRRSCGRHCLRSRKQADLQLPTARGP